MCVCVRACVHWYVCVCARVCPLVCVCVLHACEGNLQSAVRFSSCLQMNYFKGQFVSAYILYNLDCSLNYII
jgi:hypothetical protein